MTLTRDESRRDRELRAAAIRRAEVCRATGITSKMRLTFVEWYRLELRSHQRRVRIRTLLAKMERRRRLAKASRKRNRTA